MKDGAVVPDVNRLPRPVAGDVRFDPGHAGRGRAESRTRALEGSARAVEGPARHVEHVHAIDPPCDQRIDEVRFAATDVDDAGRGRESAGIQHLERYCGLLLEPADVALTLRLIDALPVLLTVHK